MNLKSRAVAVASASVVAGSVLVAASPAQAATGRYYAGKASEQIVQNFVVDAMIGSINCGISSLVKQMKNKAKTGGYLTAIAAMSGEIAAKTAGTSATCKLAKQFALAAATTAVVDLAYGRVWIEDASTADSCGVVSQKITYTYLVGPSPARTTRFSGSVKVPCSF